MTHWNGDRCQGLVPELLASHDAEPTRSQAAGTETSEHAGDTLRMRFERLQSWQSRFLGAERIDERLKLLVAFGLSDHDIAKAVPNAQARSIRRWRTEGPPLTRLAERWEPIDDLCTIIRYLLSDGTYDENGIVAWLRSRQPELGNQRPLDVIRAGDFDAVTAAAAQLLISVRVDDREQLPLPHRPSVTRLSTRYRVS